ncbi:reverse transcriptase [Gossypium australe]|uniref:Reverse transcriptase n=1 Tax=Gossypium australe TaxID=47621 RepID=A0A5B6V0M3_9ROSI|nr:reverse transcriptase [Gossypium australe]
MAKVIANRLRIVMDKCIDLAQSAFVPGRLISDNVLLAYEFLHTLKHKREGKKGLMAVKLDMGKAYDMVEWNFVEEIIKKLGFDSEWVALLMKCVTTMSYSVVLNGVRQGNPLSPFLFLFCGEGLSSLTRLAMQGKIIREVKASRSSPQVSHLLFTDDYILFGGSY